MVQLEGRNERLLFIKIMGGLLFGLSIERVA